MIKVLFFSLILVMASSTYAALLAENQQSEEEYRAMARSRTYPNGSEEEDLKIKESVVAPTVSVFKSNVDAEVLKEFQKKKEEEAAAASEPDSETTPPSKKE